MQITVSGKQVDVGEAFQGYVEQNLADVVDKYFDHGIESSVTVSRAPMGLRVDITVHAGRGVVVQSHGEADTAHPAFETALERIAKRLRRYKRRLKDHNRKERSEAKQGVFAAQSYIIASPDTSPADGGDDSEELGDNPAVIAEMTTEIASLSVAEAVMRMDLADRSALMFRNAGNGRLNVVYRRRDGNIGWIDPDTDTTSV
ncbi:MAG: ribosome-associated translation inhibitor RaiA [Rhodospirillaceae bacterium]